MPPDALGEAGQHGAGRVGQRHQVRSGAVGFQGHAHLARPGEGQRIEHDDRACPGRPAGVGERCQIPGSLPAGCVAALVSVPPAGQQVEVDLIRLGAGDRVVVRAEHQQPPRLVKRQRRVGRPGQPGERGQPLAVLRGDLRGALCLLGVDVGDVLARVDRVHVPGLRRDPDVPLRGVLAHRGEELRWHRGHEPRPDVPGVPVPVDPGGPAGRDHVVGADRQQHIAGGRDRRQLAELLVSGLLRGRQAGRLVGHPAGAVMVRHVAGQQAGPGRRQPLELRGELHPQVVADAPVRPPLVVRAPGPGRFGESGRSHQAGVTGIVPERVQHPGHARVGAEHLPLVAKAVHHITDRRLSAGQVGVRLVVATADDLDPAGLDEAEQIRAILRMRVEVRLQVVDLGQHELVVGIPPGRLEVQADQLERGPDVRQAAVGVRQEDPGFGVLALGAPPDRVVVEVADHPHRPAGLGPGDGGRPFGPQPGGLAVGDHCHLPGAPSGERGGDRDPDFDLDLLAPARCRHDRGPRGGHRWPLDADGDGYPS